MQPRNLSLGVAKQLGPDGPGEGRQARAGALCALACVILARHLRKEVLKRLGVGREGKEREGKRQQGWSDHSRSSCLLSLFRVSPFSMLQALWQCRKDVSELHDNFYLALVQSFPGFPLL